MAGEPWATATTWNRFAPTVYGIASRALGRDSDAEDVTQEVFYRLFSRIGTLKNPDAFRSFVVSFAIRIVKWELRRRRARRWIMLSDSDRLPEMAIAGRGRGIAPGPASFLRVLDQLSARERLVFALRHLESMTLEEIAAALEISLSTVKRTLSRAATRVGGWIGARCRPDRLFRGKTGGFMNISDGERAGPASGGRVADLVRAHLAADDAVAAHGGLRRGQRAAAAAAARGASPDRAVLPGGGRPSPPRCRGAEREGVPARRRRGHRLLHRGGRDWRWWLHPFVRRLRAPCCGSTRGRELRLMAGARGRLSSVDGHGARFAIEEGEAEVKVTPRPGARWLVDAGPFLITVHGTAFTASWNGATERLDIHMKKGLVSVTGPLADGMMAVRAGQHLTVNIKKREVLLRQIDGDAKGAGDRPRPDVAPRARRRASGAGRRPWRRPRALRGTDGCPGRPSSSATRPDAPRSWAAALAAGDLDAILADAERRGMPPRHRRGEQRGSGGAGRRRPLSPPRRRSRVRRCWPSARASRGSERAADSAFLLGRLRKKSRPAGEARRAAVVRSLPEGAPRGRVRHPKPWAENDGDRARCAASSAARKVAERIPASIPRRNLRRARLARFAMSRESRQRAAPPVAGNAADAVNRGCCQGTSPGAVHDSSRQSPAGLAVTRLTCSPPEDRIVHEVPARPEPDRADRPARELRGARCAGTSAR